MRTAIYARVSTHDQQTLPMQVEAMKNYAAQRGWKISSIVEEIGSGAKQRPQREQLLLSARKREIDIILVWKLDRFGRSVSDLVLTLKELQDLNVGFVSLTEALDFTTAAGRAMAGLLAVFAEFERDLLRERVKAGISQAKKDGKSIGRPKTALNHEKEIRELFRKNISKSEIARRFKIDPRSVRRIINSAMTL